MTRSRNKVSTYLTTWGNNALQTRTLSGGTESTITVNGSLYRLHAFTSTGTLTVNANAPMSVECLVIAGGGGAITAGGGAGGYFDGSVFLSGGSFTVTVGAGGGVASTGSDSVFASVTTKAAEAAQTVLLVLQVVLVVARVVKVAHRFRAAQ